MQAEFALVPLTISDTSQNGPQVAVEVLKTPLVHKAVVYWLFIARRTAVKSLGNHLIHFLPAVGRKPDNRLCTLSSVSDCFFENVLKNSSTSSMKSCLHQ